MGRINSPFPSGVRHSVIMSDKATLTFDIFEPENPHPDGGMNFYKLHIQKIVRKLLSIGIGSLFWVGGLSILCPPNIIYKPGMDLVGAHDPHPYLPPWLAIVNDIQQLQMPRCLHDCRYGSDQVLS